MAPFDFSRASVFVAGGTSGINLGIAKGFAAAGARVAVMSRNPERVRAAETELRQSGAPAALGLVGDVRHAEEVREAMRLAAEAHGPFDVLVSGAAGNFLCPAVDLSPNGFKVVVDIDLIGTFHVMRMGYDFARRPGASFINISAPQSTHPSEMQVHVCAAKAGLDQVMRVLALEWGPAGVRVNSIMPGPIAETGGLDKLITDDRRAALASGVPLRRLGEKTDIANLALFLASPLASFITGALIPADGGISLLGGRNYAGPPVATPRNPGGPHV